MSKKIDLKEAKCTALNFESAVEFRASAESKELIGFDIEAYTGAPVDRWWGKLVVDIQGITAKAKMPIFRNHDHSQIVGYSKGFSKEKNFSVSGVFSQKTAAAKEVMELAKESFPWQASIGVTPKVITEVKQGSSLEVNGKTVKGPAEVWSQSVVSEVSFVPLGADSNTRVSVFSEKEEAANHRVIEPENKKSEVVMDLETLKKEHPDLVEAITQAATAGFNAQLDEARKKGATAERERIQSVRLQLVPGHEELVEKLAFDGVTTGPEAAVQIIQAEKALRVSAAESFKNSANKPVESQPPADDPLEGKSDEEKARAKWDNDESLRNEFVEFENFLAYQNRAGFNVKTTYRGE